MLIPSFVRPGIWDFGVNVCDDDNLPFGFQPAPAREATSAFGFYLFHHVCESLSPRHMRPWTSPFPGTRRVALHGCDGPSGQV